MNYFLNCQIEKPCLQGIKDLVKKYAEDTLLAGDTMHTAYAKYELKPKT